MDSSHGRLFINQTFFEQLSDGLARDGRCVVRPATVSHSRAALSLNAPCWRCFEPISYFPVNRADRSDGVPPFRGRYIDDRSHSRDQTFDQDLLFFHFFHARHYSQVANCG
jgi:hypothetical protein